MKPDRKRQQHCSDCGTWIGDKRNKRNEAVCGVCAEVRRIRRNEMMKHRPVKIHSSLMPLLLEIADDMSNTESYTVDIQTNDERIVVTWVSLIGDTVKEVWKF